MSDLTKTVGKNIKRYRQARGYTQEKLAEMAEVSINYISQLETGLKNPSLPMLEKIAKILDIYPRDLLTSDKEINKELKELLLLLKDKDPKHIKFVIDVTNAYFKNLEKNQI